MQTVVVFVSGGVVQDVQVPQGVKVLVRDYDVDTAVGESVDSNNEPYLQSTWEHADDEL